MLRPGPPALPLARAGYDVVGIDDEPEAIHEAMRRISAPVSFVVHDMRRISELPRRFDAAICMWQSFGHFDAGMNASILRQIAGRLRVGGRLILDIYNRDFFEQHQGTRTFERNGRAITETKSLCNDRRSVRLGYGDGANDEFEWQEFTVAEIRGLAESCDLRMQLACCQFDVSWAPRADVPRMQLVFDRFRVALG